MTEDPNQVSPSGTIPNEPNPETGKGIPFAVEIAGSVGRAVDDPGGIPSFPYGAEEFNPVYYPDRYTDTIEKEVKRDARQCGGEDVTIDETKNPEFHATGIVLDGNVSDFRAVRSHNGPVNLITPLTDNDGGMEVVITKARIGEIVGWDGLYNQWQFNYTLDMVSTGVDTGSSDTNQVVSDVLAEYRSDN